MNMTRLRTSLFQIFIFLISETALLRAELPLVIDTHVHLWHLDRPEGIYWIPKDHPHLYRSFMPRDHEAIALQNGVDGTIIVQAGQHLPDNQWNLDITAHNPSLYRGVVGNLSQIIGTREFKPLFNKLCQDKRYLGYRISGRTSAAFSEQFFQDLETTAAHGKTLDILVGSYSLEEVARIAKRVPKLKIIINHLGGLTLDGKSLDPKWIVQFQKVAQSQNVHCKVSALFGRTKKQPAPLKLDYYTEILDLATKSFGADRIIFGSDWPVTRSTADYSAVLKLTRSYFDQKGEDLSKKVFALNAAKFYGIKTTRVEPGHKKLPLPGESLRINGKDAFIILPPKTNKQTPWVWYAPTLKGLPSQSEVWMFKRFLAQGIAVAGIDVGESYGSPDGRKGFSQLYNYLTQQRNFSSKPCLFARSRGGLMLYNWAVENPKKVGGIVGIYPVCNLESYPGLKRAAGAYHLSPEALKKGLPQQNPISRLQPLAEAKVPIFHLHGDRDQVVPLKQNTAILAETYRKLGGSIEVEIAPGQGHNMWSGFFQSENLTRFAIEQALGK